MIIAVEHIRTFLGQLQDRIPVAVLPDKTLREQFIYNEPPVLFVFLLPCPISFDLVVLKLTYAFGISSCHNVDNMSCTEPLLCPRHGGHYYLRIRCNIDLLDAAGANITGPAII
jgi:hypothetical protein